MTLICSLPTSQECESKQEVAGASWKENSIKSLGNGMTSLEDRALGLYIPAPVGLTPGSLLLAHAGTTLEGPEAGAAQTGRGLVS